MANPGTAPSHCTISFNQSHFRSNYSALGSMDHCPAKGKNWPALIILVFIFFTVGGNILVILAVSLEKKLQNATNFFLRSLAVADMLVGVLVMPASLLNILNNYSWPLPQVLCPMWIFLDVLFSTASIMHLCAISLDRYIGIRNPIQHSRSNSSCRAMAKITVVWTISMVVSLPIPVIGLQDEQKVFVNGTCQLNEPHFVLVGSFVAFFVPLLIMVVCYCLTVKVLQQHTAAFSQDRGSYVNVNPRQPSPQPSVSGISLLNEEPSTNQSKGAVQPLSLSPLTGHEGPPQRGQGRRGMTQAIKNERRASKVLGVVFFLFLVMWCPFFITNVVVAVCQNNCSNLFRLLEVFVWVGYVSSGVNPLVYTLFNKTYRHAFSRHLQCRYHKRTKPFLVTPACQVYSVTPTPVVCESSFTDTNGNGLPAYIKGFNVNQVHKQPEEMPKDSISSLHSPTEHISSV
ncbi:5-hydroxytryptamine receptor 2A-like [Astyanax mexicanus]|uniref:5-hydroxytryptamine receptor 2A-like n=1 Tax=Astyanax mexicanus TaxID=7994 RepID=A0A8T2L2G8_ASTMX|nr:5-hydroxytryptamine receptor 2A-like [Astyanax mexicanus]